MLAATPGQLLGAVLQDYKRARLKELCRALGFSEAGKEKSDLVTRPLGAAESDSPALPPQLSLGIADSLSPPIERNAKGNDKVNDKGNDKGNLPNPRQPQRRLLGNSGPGHARLRAAAGCA